MNFIMIGAHPDDCEFCAGGTTVRLLEAGHRVKMVSLTNEDKGHMVLKPPALARVRRGEARAATEGIGADWLVLDVPDCNAVPTVALREKVVGLIREWKADVVISHRPNDYHPDHRNTGVVVQDTAYLVMVPLFNPRVPALRTNPIYLYFMDRFRSPEPFRPDVIVPIDGVLARKVDALNRMPSQLHEWLPWIDGVQDQVPADPEGRKAFTESFIRNQQQGAWTRQAVALYGKAAAGVRMLEAFQLCEYGRQPTLAELRGMFPGMPARGKPGRLSAKAARRASPETDPISRICPTFSMPGSGTTSGNWAR